VIHTRTRGRSTGRRLVATLAVAAALLSACGGGDDDASTGSPAPSATTGTDATTTPPEAPSTDPAVPGTAGGDTPVVTDGPTVTTAPGGASGDDCAYVDTGLGAPVRGDTLTVQVGAPATSVNPATVNTAFVTYTTLAYESLMYRGADGTIVPALAESWEYTDDTNTAFEFTLRDGVVFTDGNPVDAAAVVASLEYMKAANTSSPYLGAFSAIEATGPLTVRITTSSPNPMLPTLLSPKYGIGQIISPTGLANPDQLTVEFASQGAGAYILDPSDTLAGDHYTYRANPDYYDPCKQHYDTVVLRVISDGQAALNALQSGQIDAMVGGADTYPQAQSAGLQIAKVPLTWVGINIIDRGGQVTPALADARVRQAINYAIDRDTITTALLGEFGEATSTITLPGGEGWSEEAAVMYPYDPEQARNLLAEAGYADGFTMPLLSVQFGGLDVLAEALKGMLADVGITVEVETVTDEQAYVTGAMDNTWPAFMAVYGAQPMFIMGPNLFLTEAAMFNGFHTDDADLRALYDAFVVAPLDEQAALAQQIQLHLSEQAWFAPVAFTAYAVFARTDLGGVLLTGGAPTPEVLDWYEVG